MGSLDSFLFHLESFLKEKLGSWVFFFFQRMTNGRIQGFSGNLFSHSVLGNEMKGV